MSRLLFAAARGARIGWQTLSGKWHPALSLNYAQSEGGQAAYHIHPADEHLQYGPVSTALRRVAEQPKIFHQSLPSLPPYFAFSVGHETDAEMRSVFVSDELTHSLFLLILAECLADEGM